MNKKINTGGLDYATVANLARTNEVVTKKVPMSALEFSQDGAISISGVPVESKNAAPVLLRELGLSKRFYSKYENLAGKEALKAMVDTLKAGLAVKKGGTLTVIANPSNKSIVGFLPGGQDYVSNDFAINSFEKIMNDYGDKMKVNNFEIFPNGGMSISAISKEDYLPSRDKRFVGEEFNPGFSIDNNPEGGLSIQGFVNRLVCTNGMSIVDTFGNYTVKNLNQAAYSKFFDLAKSMAANNFIPGSFDQNFNRATNNVASLAEIMYARRVMKANSSLKDDTTLAAFLPEFGTTVNRLAVKGIDYATCSDKLLQNCPVPGVTIWDVVNRMTDFGSHDYGYDATFAPIQQASGKLFGKKSYDTEALTLATALMR